MTTQRGQETEPPQSGALRSSESSSRHGLTQPAAAPTSYQQHQWAKRQHGRKSSAEPEQHSLQQRFPALVQNQGILHHIQDGAKMPERPVVQFEDHREEAWNILFMEVGPRRCGPPKEDFSLGRNSKCLTWKSQNSFTFIYRRLNTFLKIFFCWYRSCKEQQAEEGWPCFQRCDFSPQRWENFGVFFPPLLPGEGKKKMCFINLGFFDNAGNLLVHSGT